MGLLNKTYRFLLIGWCILIQLGAQSMSIEARHHPGDTLEVVQQFNQLPLDMVEFFEEYSPQSSEILDTQEQSASSSEDFHFDGLAGYQVCFHLID